MKIITIYSGMIHTPGELHQCHQTTCSQATDDEGRDSLRIQDGSENIYRSTWIKAWPPESAKVVHHPTSHLVNQYIYVPQVSHYQHRLPGHIYRNILLSGMFKMFPFIGLIKAIPGPQVKMYLQSAIIQECVIYTINSSCILHCKSVFFKLYSFQIINFISKFYFVIFCSFNINTDNYKFNVHV